MRLSTAAFLASVALVAGAPAFAQGLGDEVRVNPIAGGSSVLLYPGGQYMRVVRPLLMPGQGIGPVRLHLPRKGAVRTRPADIAAAPPQPKAPPQSQSKPQAAAAATPPGGYYSGFGAPMGAGSLFGGYGAVPPPAPAPKPAAPPRPAQLARAEPAPPVTPVDTGLTKRSVILFAPQAADPAESALGAIKFLAGDLNAAMVSPTSRIQIQAFGGTRGDKGSDARRLSLKRALTIRQVLIDDGVAAERIDVRAMGGADDSGPADRVDVYVKA